MQLEVYLSGNLDDSWTAGLACCADSGECAESDPAGGPRRILERARGWIELRRRVQRRPICVIEHVECFQAKLNEVLRILAVFDLSEQRHIPVVQPRAANGVDTGVVPDTALGGRVETAGINVGEERSVASRFVRVTRQNDTWCEVLAPGNQAVQCRTLCGGQYITGRLRRADAEAAYAGKLPAAECGTCDAVIQKRSGSRGARNVINVIHREALSSIEGKRAIVHRACIGEMGIGRTHGFRPGVADAELQIFAGTAVDCNLQSVVVAGRPEVV